ncbi:unnamed protein product [Rotaria sp. Silwood1]|nr:unnamed protein product [Rotaria sp. Silwood1]CAF1652788.1 unnamed protein product [Rotaria sp. Silwood1]
MSMDNSTTDQVTIAAGVSSSFPDVYEVPILPKALLKNIEAGNLKSFGPHCQGRQILIDATIWKDALQTKLKRTRNDHPNNDLVQEFRLKYSKLGSGRPVKQKIGEIAERDRHKQVTNN